MELKDYRAEFLQRVGLDAMANSNFKRPEFTELVMSSLIESDEIDDFIDCFYDGIIGSRGKRVELDGYDWDEFDQTLSVVICKYNGSSDPSEKLTKTEIESMAERARRFIEGSIDGIVQDSIEESEPAYGLANLIRSKDDVIARYRIIVISDLEKSDRIKSLNIDGIGSKEVVLHVWDISNLYDLEISKKGFDDIKINLEDFETKSIQCIRVCSKEDVNYDAYLCSIPGKLLADLYSKFGARLLESNVRSFLKLQTKTNKAIRATILKEPSMFFAYNNGITATATDIDVESGSKGICITGFTALQIVNGGQTTVSLYTVGKSRDQPDLSEINVPMKITVVSRETAEEIVPKISRSANTQNKVSESDFFSNSPFHKTIESFSRRIMTPQLPGVPFSTKWYYERTRGQYQQDLNSKTGVDLKKFKAEYPKSNVFNKTDLSKYRNSFKQLPHIVSKGAQYSLVEFSKTVDADHLEKYNEKYYRDSIALGILFRRIQDMVSQQPWYNGGYRAQIVTYSIAKLAHIVESMNATLDLDAIWESQALFPALEEQMVRVMKVVNDSFAEDKREENVGQWCKKEACWMCVKARSVEVLPSFKSCLISQKKAQWMEKSATKQQRVANYTKDRIEVYNLGVGYWGDVNEWGLEHDSFSWEDKELMKKIMSMEKNVVKERDCYRALVLLDRLKSEGYNR